MLGEADGESPEAVMTQMPYKTNAAIQEMVRSFLMFLDLDIGNMDAFIAA
jgi:hypothetical protein